MTAARNKQQDRQAAIAKARDVWECDPAFLDTETTGLSPSAEVCEIAIVNRDGDTLFNTLVKPKGPIAPDASRAHGILDKDVKSAPDFSEIAQDLLALLNRHPVVAYNAAFDSRILTQSATAALGADGAPQYALHWNWVCAMELYSKFYGYWDVQRQEYRWLALRVAARQCRLPMPENLHRALADAELTRLLLKHITEQ